MEQKITKYTAVKNEAIAEAILDLASPLLQAASNDKSIIEGFIEIAVKSWNISLFPASDENKSYDQDIDSILPKHIGPEKSLMIRNFVKYMIMEKQKRYPDYLKGIKSYKCHIEDGKVGLVVDALPVKPFGSK